MSCQNDDEHSAIDELAVAPRAEWTAPMLRRMRAGDAENGLTPTNDDAQFTAS